MTIPSDDSFFTFEGKGILSYEGKTLSGEVKDKNGLAHFIEFSVDGGKVEGTFETMQSDADPFKLKGVVSNEYDARIGLCWHNIVAHDAANALTLVAVSDRCEP